MRTRINSDLIEALPVAFQLLSSLLPQIGSRHTLERLLEDELHNSLVTESLSASQRLLVWRLCQLSLDSAYN